jgi:2-phospho-L-lactate/phosphoenolpyruvate guanylyltransferase
VLHDHVTIVPVKPFEEGKSRLGCVLSHSERARLNSDLFERTMGVAEEFGGAGSTIVISRSRDVLNAARRWNAKPIWEEGSALNAAVHQAALAARSMRPKSILVLPTDLPLLTIDALRRTTSFAAQSGLVIVPDRSEVGTNLLFYSPPSFDRFCFGPMSFSQHCAAGREAGFSVVEARVSELQFDLDTPQDYRDWSSIARPTASVAVN